VGRSCGGAGCIAKDGAFRMTHRKFFSLEPGEEFFGVIRPSMWALVPRSLALLALVVLPLTLWSSFLGFQVVGLGSALLSMIIGIVGLRDIRRYYLENGLYITNFRAIDVFAKRKRTRVTEIRWTRVHSVHAVRRGISSLFGYGAVWVYGIPEEQFSLVIQPVWKPDLVTDIVRKVHSRV
jgi:hypothetical protein